MTAMILVLTFMAVIGVAICAIAFLIVETISPRRARQSIDQIVQAEAEKCFAEFSKPGGKLDDLVEAEFRAAAEADKAYSGKLNQTGFLIMMAYAFMRCDKTMTFKVAMAEARSNLADFLREEKISFGHPDYDWTQDGAKIFSAEQMQYWESAA